MKDEDPFEERLRSQSLRPVPPAWREAILEAASSKAASHGAPSRGPTNSWATLVGWVSAVLWPHPRAWAGLAAVWLVVLGLNLSHREPSRPELARASARPSPEMRELLRQQEQLLAELAGPFGKNQTERTRLPAAQPRSQRRDEFMNA